MTERMRIGDLTRRAGVTPRTVRYYESMGLIPPGQREGGRQRTYDEQMLKRLAKIDQLKKLGLSLEEIAGVIDLYFIDPSGRRPKRKVLQILQQHLSDVDSKVTEMKKLKAELRSHIRRFESWLEDVGNT